MPPIIPSVSETWYSIDAAYPHKVTIYDTYYVPPWGFFVIYNLPKSSPNEFPRTSHLEIFTQHYRPLTEIPCNPYPPVNSSSKTFSQWVRSFFTAAPALWTRVISFYKKPW